MLRLIIHRYISLYYIEYIWSISGRQLGQIPCRQTPLCSVGYYTACYSCCHHHPPLYRLIPFDNICFFIVRNKQLRVSKYCDISQIYKSPKNALNISSNTSPPPYRAPLDPQTIYSQYFITTMTHMFGMIFGWARLARLMGDWVKVDSRDAREDLTKWIYI